MTGHFEAKKHAYRQTQDGVVISFVMHPSDVSATIATAALGTRYMIGFAEIGEDGKPISPVAQRSEQAAYNRQVEGSKPSGATKLRERFQDMPSAKQAAIRSGDKSFQQFICATDEENAAQVVREMCGVTSRSELNFNKEAEARWLDLETRYQQHLTDIKYKEVRR